MLAHRAVLAYQISRLSRKTSRNKNRMLTNRNFADYAARLRKFIRRHSSGAPPAARLAPAEVERQFSQLALDLFGLHYAHNPAYRCLGQARKIFPLDVAHWMDIPAVPAVAFKEMEMTTLCADERTRVFHSSGTTDQPPSRHFHDVNSLALYEASLLPWFQAHLLGDLDGLVERGRLGPLDQPAVIALTPSPDHVPHSSLVHMFATVQRDFGSRDSIFAGRLDDAGGWSLDVEQLLFALRKSMCANRPLLLLGTAFNFVHLLDHFAAHNIRYRLVEGSRVLETGGYKGRSRSLPKEELHALITKHLGIPGDRIVCEYGMSELSSQAYDHTIAGANVEGTGKASDQRVFRFPPWARVTLISPETGREVGEGETGLIRVLDLANLRSVLAVQTEDLGVRCGAGFKLLGRATEAEPRGCSLMTI